MPFDMKEAARDLIAKAWADPDFEQQLVDQPKICLAQAGLLEPGLVNDPACTVSVVRDVAHLNSDPSAFIFHLPERPSLGNKLSEADLERAIERLARSTVQTQSPMSTCCCDISIAPNSFD